jgi:hypothetical protein
MHHKSGRTQLDNIHDDANLIALCTICHFAFDNKEWTFLPVDMTTWIQEAEAEVEREAEVDGEAEVNGEAEIDGDFILRCNARRDVDFQRWRLKDDPESEASQDGFYASAFTDEPIKRWLGEPGVAILGNAAISETPTFPGELRNTLNTYRELLGIWVNYNKPCSKDDCRICNRGNDEDDEDDKGDDENDENDENDEDDEDDEGDNGQSDQKRRRMSRQGQQDGPSKPPPKSHQTGQSSTRKLRSGNRSIRTTTPGRSKVSMPRHITRKRNRSSERKTSALYDKSVPYSHREGYTFAKFTAHDFIRKWQARST